jgi:glycosyltransferase involved in cell wall biosynthesis
MSDPPLISVALCTYNGERFLREQLDSVLAQDYPRIEIVAVDDASTDGTFALIESYAARDARMRVWRNPSNVGFRRNFELALEQCRGDLIAPCDQDDVWLPSKLSILQRALGDAAAAYCDSELVDEQGRSIGVRMSDRRPMGRIDDPAVFLFGDCVSAHAVLLRRNLLERALPVPVGVYPDWWLGLLAACSGPVEYVSEPLVRYRQHACSVTDVLHRRQAAPALRPAGYKLAALEETECRLRAAAAVPGARDEAFFATALRLWLGWKRQWLSPRLAAFMLRHRERLFALRPDHRWRHARDAVKHLWGLPLKRFVGPRGYRRA